MVDVEEEEEVERRLVGLVGALMDLYGCIWNGLK